MLENFLPKKAARPRVNSESQRELDRAAEQIDEFHEQIEQLNMDRNAPVNHEEQEPQTKLSAEDIAKSKQIYLKPKRSISSREKFNENFRKEYNFAKEYVQFIAEHKEIIGESIEIWTKPFPGMPAEEWMVPVNKPVWGPRYLAEQIKRKYYRRLRMEEGKITSSDHAGHYFGTLVADTTVQRLDALPVSGNKSIFMGTSNF